MKFNASKFNSSKIYSRSVKMNHVAKKGNNSSARGRAAKMKCDKKVRFGRQKGIDAKSANADISNKGENCACLYSQRG